MKCLSKNKSASILNFLFLYHSRTILVLSILVSIANGIANVLLIALINRTLTTSIDNYPFFFGYFCILATIVISCRVLSGIMFAKLNQDTMARMREFISERILSAPFNQIESLGVSRAQSVISDDVTNVSLLFFTLPNIIIQGIIVLGCLLYLAWLSWPVFFLALFVFTLGSFGYSRGGIKAINSLKVAGKAQDNLFNCFRELFSGAKELKLHFPRARAFLADSLGREIDMVRHHRTRALIIYALGTGWILFLFYVFLGMVIFSPAVIPSFESSKISGYVIVFLFMLIPLGNLLNGLPSLNAARVSSNRIGDIFSELNQQDNINQKVHSREFVGLQYLTLSGLTHNYFSDKHDKIFQLGPINMRFKRGEVTFIIGSNGSGKTTLAKLLTGLYTPKSGTITVDEFIITDNNRANYRHLFSAIFSDFYIFKNLSGLDTIDPIFDERANRLLTKLHIDHKVKVKEGCLSTRNLSLGQQKRLALVIAYLEDRPIYLFDEWAADQDPQFKKVFYEDLLPELAARGKIVVAITHDDSFFHLADHCLKLDNGQFVGDIGFVE
ncbi:cyclic peptide export ABC transporter [Enterobacter hormaechei]|nr:cyclic peptide export ABC transporter [Enterobacter hormaechei]